ncbi:MAG: hypothetical protein K6T99_03320 [Armatimonadetes bacterium]|nr:hypothetical protein [Armatimonadota bacterium]
MQICPRCGSENEDNRAACWNCFAQLSKPAAGKQFKQLPKAAETRREEILAPPTTEAPPSSEESAQVSKVSPEEETSTFGLATAEAEEAVPSKEEDSEPFAPFVFDLDKETEPESGTSVRELELSPSDDILPTKEEEQEKKGGCL